MSLRDKDDALAFLLSFAIMSIVLLVLKHVAR
jgi:hypothetical protein